MKKDDFQTTDEMKKQNFAQKIHSHIFNIPNSYRIVSKQCVTHSVTLQCTQKYYHFVSKYIQLRDNIHTKKDFSIVQSKFSLIRHNKVQTGICQLMHTHMSTTMSHEYNDSDMKNESDHFVNNVNHTAPLQTVWSLCQHSMVLCHD